MASGLTSVFEILKETVGIDLAEVIQGRVVGTATGEGISAGIANKITQEIDQTLNDEK